MILTLLITSSVLILGIFCLRKLTFERISMRARYALWLPVGGYMLLSTHRFMRYLKKNRSMLSEEVLPKDFVKRLSVRGMKVYQVQGLPSPCLVGGHIYVGGRAADDPQSLSHILAHEYSHAMHLDRFWAFLRSFFTALYWFDPLVWAAAYAARQDSELACDEAAVELLGESERFVYGRTLLNLLESGNGEECPGMTFMLDRGEKGVKERIGVLAGCVRKKGTAAVLVFGAVFLLCGCAFTGAAQGDAKILDSAVVGQDGESGGQKVTGQDGVSAIGQDGESAGGRDAQGTDAQEAAGGQNAAGQDKAAGGQNAAGQDKAAGGQDTVGQGDSAAGWDDSEEPFVNGAGAHYDMEIDFINPCPDYNRISDPYGERTHPVTGKVRTHSGVDLAADEGADILAAAAGTVFMTGYDAEMGNYVVLWHVQSGQMTYYEHCKTVEVEKGQEVTQGQKIATVGQTGKATGSFLHFAVSSGTNWEEPYFLELN